MLSRAVHREVPPRVEYSLTPSGQVLRDVVEAMNTWGGTWIREH